MMYSGVLIEKYENTAPRHSPLPDEDSSTSEDALFVVRQWRLMRLIFSVGLIVVFSGMLGARMMYQEATFNFLFQPSGAILIPLGWNNTLKAYRAVGADPRFGNETTCDGMFSCMEGVCNTWSHTGVSVVGWVGLGACPPPGTFWGIVSALFERSPLEDIALGCWIGSSIFGIVSAALHTILIQKEKIEPWLRGAHLISSLGLPLAFVLNMISASTERGLIADRPPNYLEFWEWWETGLALGFYVVKVLVYLRA